jgi:hypothetical protein
MVEAYSMGVGITSLLTRCFAAVLENRKQSVLINFRLFKLFFRGSPHIAQVCTTKVCFNAFPFEDTLSNTPLNNAPTAEDFSR